MDFKTIGLTEELIKGLEAQGIYEPTQVQQLAIVPLLVGKDVILQSETGSGKTLAYLLPLYAQNIPPIKGMQMIVLVPTHELAMQVHRQVQTLSANSGISLQSMPIFGDVNIKSQIERLREKPQVIIGTAGRILELIKLKKISAHTIKTVVIDEADKLLDKKNIEHILPILKCVMRDTQIAMCSASISPATLREAEKITKSPVFIKTDAQYTIPSNIEHWYFVCEHNKKLEVFRKIATALQPTRALVFINKTEDIEVATCKLQYHGFTADCIHGTSVKEDRKKAIADLSAGKTQYLVASDLAARGLHIEDVAAVFSISIPVDAMDYLHRAGRTGRGGKQGLSISIVTPQEIALLHKYEKKFGIAIQNRKIVSGKILNPPHDLT